MQLEPDLLKMYFYPGFQLTNARCSCGERNEHDILSKMNNTNCSVKNDDSVQILNLITATICILIGIMAILGNGLVFAAMKNTKSLRTSTNYFITSLALADFFIGTFIIPLSVAGSLQRPAWFFSNLFDFLLTQSFAASTFNLSAISFDRYLAITNPLRYPLIMTKQRSKTTIAIMWLISLSVATLNFIDFNGRYILRLVVTVVVFVLPFVSIVYFYWRIFQEANRQRVVIRTQNTLQSVEIELHGKSSLLSAGLREHRAAVTIAIVIGIFAFCWTPNMLIAILQVSLRVGNNCLHNVAFTAGWHVTMTIAFANSGLNPLIYAARNHEFRRAFKKAITYWKKQEDELLSNGASDNLTTENNI